MESYGWTWKPLGLVGIELLITRLSLCKPGSDLVRRTWLIRVPQEQGMLSHIPELLPCAATEPTI